MKSHSIAVSIVPSFALGTLNVGNQSIFSSARCDENLPAITFYQQLVRFISPKPAIEGHRQPERIRPEEFVRRATLTT